MLQKRVLVIYTGGTIGMMKNSQGALAPSKNIESRLRQLPQIHDEQYWKEHLDGTAKKDYLVLPEGKDTDLKILFKIHEYGDLKDSSDFDHDDWIRQARDIKRFYHDYDGFVILHGTDTTAYGACMLSFLLETIGKTVVLTGAQVPIFQPRSDGNNNLVCSIIIAATQLIPEVTVFFGVYLFRGTRVKKISNLKMYAFGSPNFPPLLEAKVNMEVNPKMLLYPPGSVPNECRIHEQLSKKVIIIKMVPTMTLEIVKKLCEDMEGILLETYGNGNMPMRKKEICEEFARAVRNKVIVVNVSQCINGSVLGNPIYEAGMLLQKCGVLPAYDMTSEAAFAKLCYVLSKEDMTHEEKIKLMKTSIRGELINPSDTCEERAC